MHLRKTERKKKICNGIQIFPIGLILSKLLLLEFLYCTKNDFFFRMKPRKLYTDKEMHQIKKDRYQVRDHRQISLLILSELITLILPEIVRKPKVF